MRTQRAAWQSMLLTDLLRGRSTAADLESADISLAQAQHIWASDFCDGPAVIACLAEWAPGYRAPQDVLEDYFDYLESRGALGANWSLDSGRIFDARVELARRELARATRLRQEAQEKARETEAERHLAIQVAEDARKAEEHATRAAAHRTRLLERVTEALSGASPEEQERFDFERWLRMPLADGRTPYAEMDNTLFPFSALMSDLKKVPRIYKPGGAPLPDLLNLPVEAHQARRCEEQQKAIDNREARLKAMFQIVGEALLPDFLDTPRKSLDGLTPLAFGRRSDDDQWRIEQLLVSSPQAKALHDASMAAAVQFTRECRRVLASAAEHVYLEHADTWLRTRHVRLGATPHDACTDRTSLNRCLKTLERDCGQGLPAKWKPLDDPLAPEQDEDEPRHR